MKFLDSRYAQIAAYVLIVLLAVVGFTKLDAQQDKIESLINQRTQIRNAQAMADCENQRITREGLRNSVITTAQLGRDLIGDGATSGQLTAIAQVNAFERDQLAKLPLIECPPALMPPAGSSG